MGAAAGHAKIQRRFGGRPRRDPGGAAPAGAMAEPVENPAQRDFGALDERHRCRQFGQTLAQPTLVTDQEGGDIGGRHPRRRADPGASKGGVDAQAQAPTGWPADHLDRHIGAVQFDRQHAVRRHLAIRSR